MKYTDEMYHAATKIMQNRADQLGLDDDELMHYGRKGMKWNETIFTDEDRARGQDVRLKQKGQRIRAEQKANREKINEMKTNVLVEKARREGRGKPDNSEPIPGKPNQLTVRDVERKQNHENKMQNISNRSIHSPNSVRKQHKYYSVTDEDIEKMSEDGSVYEWLDRAAQSPESKKANSEPTYNGMSAREHLKNLNDNLENSFPGGFDNYVNQSLTTAIDIDNAHGNNNDPDSLKNEFRQALANSINEYLSENNIPETETSKFQALYDSYAGRYDDAVDAAMGIGAYQPVFGNRKNKYRQ